jgi:cytochrome P450
VNLLTLVRGFRRDPLALLTDEHRQCGPIVRLPVPGRQIYSISDPEAIHRALTHTHRGYEKGVSRRADPTGPGILPLRPVLGDGLLTSGAELHRRQRRIMQPMFHRARIAGYADAFTLLTGEMLDGWTAGEVRDVHRDLTELTLAIIARTVFDVALDAEVITTIRRALAKHQPTMARLASPGGRVFGKRRWHRAQLQINTVLYRLIAARRERPGPDVLSLLIQARDADTGEPMAERLIRDEAMTLLLAGHETAGNALSWALHLLCADPAAQERAAGDPAFARAVWQETLRLYPPAWLQNRRLVAAETVCGQELPPGAMLLFCPWVVHRDPRWWPAPDSFRPARWLEPPGDRPRAAYFPFGVGPRQCIGNDFADLEGVTVLQTVLRRFRLGPAPGAPPAAPAPLVTLRPRDGVWLTVLTV